MAGQDDGSNLKDKVEDLAGSGSKTKEAVAAAAVSAVGALAASKGPDLVRKVVGATEEKGEDRAEHLGEKAVEGAKKGLGGAGAAGKVASKLLGGSGGGGKKTRRLPIQRWTDVAAPIDRVYEAWTNSTSSRASCTASSTSSRRTATRSVGRKRSGSAAASGKAASPNSGKRPHRLDDDERHGAQRGHELPQARRQPHARDGHMEFEPSGMVEKMASGLRFVKRAVQADLARFKAYVEMEQAKGIEYRPEPEEDDRRKGQATPTRPRRARRSPTTSANRSVRRARRAARAAQVQ